MRIRGHVPHARKHLLLLLAGLLGAAVAVAPAVAGSEASPIVNAVSDANKCSAYYPNCWSPSQVTVTSPGQVTFQNSSGVPHGVVWNNVPATPSCSGVPVNSSATSFNGSCTFQVVGTYNFYCYVHGLNMSGTVTVNASGTTTMTTTTSTTTQTTGGGGSTTTGTSTVPGPQSGSGGAGSPLAGSASQAIKLPQNQRGKAVRGSVSISTAGAGARIEVDLLAKSASLASAGHGAQVRVGRLVRPGLKAGRFSFSVPLNARARGALRRHGRLALTAEMQIKAPNGGAATVARKVLLRP
jgi:plastocyanin